MSREAQANMPNEVAISNLRGPSLSGSFAMLWEGGVSQLQLTRLTVAIFISRLGQTMPKVLLRPRKGPKGLQIKKTLKPGREATSKCPTLWPLRPMLG
jgi:hypothetical protein